MSNSAFSLSAMRIVLIYIQILQRLIVKVGINFSSKERTITEWKVN